jgi:acyl carrier protein
MADVEETVHAVLFRIIQRRTGHIMKIQAGDRLTDELGLKSLDLAAVISVLELELGVDPFARLVAITDIRTVGDLCGAYRRALLPDSMTASPAFEPRGGRRASAPPEPDRERGPPDKE